ncbi:MAG: hypothetical protein KC593_14455 [Myxococcales bacterium]|nr:hypothetical protein [Myxococcales bacterium]MCB9628013.1 hypothetical protein [Sandaracinaceae bacterium]
MLVTPTPSPLPRLSLALVCGVAACSSHGGTRSPDTGVADAGADMGSAADAGLDVWTARAPLADGVWVRVRNGCSFPLFIHGAGNGAVLQPDDAELAVGATRDYEAPRDWSAARVTAYVDGPRMGELDKVEATFQPSGDLATLNFNITYVDWVGLPMRMEAVGGECNASHQVECAVPHASLLDGCPAQLRESDRCQSARSHCLNPTNQASEYCHALDGAIADCAANVAGCGAFAAATTPEAYACSGPLSNEPRLCAALNRGMLSAPDSADTSAFYMTDPYNTYAAWVHAVCPGIYAFSYDDWLSQGGFRACRGSELRITFCPRG